jgi:hypothetical protein
MSTSRTVKHLAAEAATAAVLAAGRRQGDTVRRSHPRPGRQGDRAAPLDE